MVAPIQADGFILRTLVPEDAPAYAAAARESADTVGRWMPWCTPDYPESMALAWFEACAEAAARGDGYDLGVFDARSGAFVGGAGVNQLNHAHLFANLGYWVRTSRQRQGVAPRVVRALASFAFVELGLRRVELVIAEGNAPSAAVAEKVGATREGTLRNRLLLGGISVSAWMYSLVP